MVNVIIFKNNQIHHLIVLQFHIIIKIKLKKLLP